MAAERQQHEGSVVAAAAEPSVARRLWRVVRAVLYMLRRGLPSGRKLAMDLHLLLHRGRRIAGKALGDRFLASSRHDRSSSYAGGGGGGGKGAAAAGGGHFSCGALDPRVAVHEPSRRRREVEFSCSNTPSSATTGWGGGALGLLGAAARRRRSRRRSSSGRQHQQYRDEAEAADDGYLMQYYSCYDAAEVARVFEMLSDDEGDGDAGSVLVPGASTATPPLNSSATTPSPAQAAQLARLAAGGRQQQARVAPAGSSPADGGAQAQVDRRADEFIRRFYEQLRAQRSAASTPDYYGYAASPYGAGAASTPDSYGAGAARAPRAVTAGIA